MSSNRTTVRFDINKYFELDCIVDGHPKPKIQWYKNSKKISDSAFDSADRTYLKAAKATQSHLGEYTCLAENDWGKIKRTFKVMYNPYWSKWSGWSSCSTTCGKGVLRQHRTCHKAPHDEAHCKGLNVQMKACKLRPCKGEWTEWSDWSACSTTCGKGQMYRHRECTGDECVGSHGEIVGCFLKPCDASGGIDDTRH